eukprot:3584487-Amphidinium_carterae.3
MSSESSAALPVKRSFWETFTDSCSDEEERSLQAPTLSTSPVPSLVPSACDDSVDAAPAKRCKPEALACWQSCVAEAMVKAGGSRLQTKGFTFVSLCAGTGSGSISLKAIRERDPTTISDFIKTFIGFVSLRPKAMQAYYPIEWREMHAADCKPAAQKFMNMNVPGVGHVFDKVEDLLEEGPRWCHKHETYCSPEVLPINVVLAGFPCAPYSSQRASRYSADGGALLVVMFRLEALAALAGFVLVFIIIVQGQDVAIVFQHSEGCHFGLYIAGQGAILVSVFDVLIVVAFGRPSYTHSRLLPLSSGEKLAANQCQKRSEFKYAFQKLRWTSHKLTHVMFAVVDYLSKHLPDAAVLENVTGFLHVQQGHAKSPYAVLVEKLGVAGYHVDFVELCASAFTTHLQFGPARIYIFASRDPEVVQIAKANAEFIMEHVRKQFTPVAIEDIIDTTSTSVEAGIAASSFIEIESQSVSTV